MEARNLVKDDQLQFAGRALALKYPNVSESGMIPAQLLTIRRREDIADDLYTVLNRVQENLLRGGLCRRAAWSADPDSAGHLHPQGCRLEQPTLGSRSGGSPSHMRR